MGTRLRQASLAAGLGSLLALAVALACYALVPALAAALAATVCLGLAMGRSWLGLTALAALVTLTSLAVWTAFGTPAGYFWLNKHRLERLVAEIEAVPAIHSLNLGHDDESSFQTGSSLGGQGGGSHSFDSYRFINGTAVTHFREQVDPQASQPVIYVDDMLRSLHVPAEQYWSLRQALERLSLGGYGRGADGQVTLNEPPVGGRPWGYGYVFSPSGEAPWSHGLQETWKLAPRWFYALWG